MQVKGVNIVPTFQRQIKYCKKDLVSPKNYVWISDHGFDSNQGSIYLSRK